jgi:hypothetical protein
MIPEDELRSYDVEFIRYLFDNVRQIEQNKYDEMKIERKKQMIDIQKKLSECSLFLSLYVSFFLFLAFKRSNGHERQTGNKSG